MIYALDAVAPSRTETIVDILTTETIADIPKDKPSAIIVLLVLLLLVAVAVVSVCVIKKNKAKKNAAPPAEETNDA
jgi:flagellar basal body-associated protein FliL